VCLQWHGCGRCEHSGRSVVEVWAACKEAYGAQIGAKGPVQGKQASTAAMAAKRSPGRGGVLYVKGTQARRRNIRARFSGEAADVAGVQGPGTTTVELQPLYRILQEGPWCW